MIRSMLAMALAAAPGLALAGATTVVSPTARTACQTMADPSFWASATFAATKAKCAAERQAFLAAVAARRALSVTLKK